MNIYDFDKTIYDGDSTADFIKFCVKNYKKTLLTFIPTAWAFFLYAIGIYTKTQFKERMYRFLRYVPDIDSALCEFWSSHEKNILDYYKAQKKEDDIIISASPEFLLKPICERLGVTRLIASKVDKKTGIYTGENCWGGEKTKRLLTEYGIERCDNFYSDSFSDTPLAEIAENAYIVRRNKLTPWREYKSTTKEKLFHMLFSQEFMMFVIIGVACTFFNIFFSWIYESLFTLNPAIAFLPGYITANIASYILNATLTFKERLTVTKYVKYFISYIPNYLVQQTVVFIYTRIFPNAPGIFAYAIAAVIGLPVTFIIMKLFTFAKNKKEM